MRRLILSFGVPALLTGMVVPQGVMAQEATSAVGPVYRENFKDLIERSKAAEAKLKELGNIVEMAVSCNEQAKLYKPVEGSAGTCEDIPLKTIYCSCGDE